NLCCSFPGRMAERRPREEAEQIVWKVLRSRSGTGTRCWRLPTPGEIPSDLHSRCEYFFRSASLSFLFRANRHNTGAVAVRGIQEFSPASFSRSVGGVLYADTRRKKSDPQSFQTPPNPKPGFASQTDRFGR